MILSRIKKKVIEAETHPVVLHEIPGRVRFGIKVLKRLKKDKLPLAEHIKSVIEEIPSINEIKLNSMSGSILINFDKEKINSNQIKKFLQDVIRYLLGYSDKILSIQEKDLPFILERLTRRIKSSTDDELMFNSDDIPNDLWQVKN